MNDAFRSGYIAVVGRPNVGKSTLINHILGQKLCITSRRPQTTRHRILGIQTTDAGQFIYVDTPGLHVDNKNAMNRYMNRSATASMEDVDVILMVVENTRWTREDEAVLKRLQGQVKAPVILVLNKLDKLDNRNVLLPQIEKLSALYDFAAVVPISAEKGDNVDELEREVARLTPVGELIFDPEQLTDRSSRFLAAEIVREKLFRHLGQELPYSLTCEVELFEESSDMIHISVAIYVERSGQKRIVIGKGGSRLKSVGRDARLEMQELFGCKVHLELWVKVREGWSDNERMLKNLGYNDDL